MYDKENRHTNDIFCGIYYPHVINHHQYRFKIQTKYYNCLECQCLRNKENYYALKTQINWKLIKTSNCVLIDDDID